MIDIRQALVIALGSIRSAKLRSALTTLGIIIGVAAVVANVSAQAPVSTSTLLMSLAHLAPISSSYTARM